MEVVTGTPNLSFVTSAFLPENVLSLFTLSRFTRLCTYKNVNKTTKTKKKIFMLTKFHYSLLYGHKTYLVRNYGVLTRLSINTHTRCSQTEVRLIYVCLFNGVYIEPVSSLFHVASNFDKRRKTLV